ncbi:MAG: hypothetical protein M9924_15805 [Rhizobiaceae bacterium]|nr:hypothetical protein [Rhizobiaceae bacterium]
MRVGTHAMRDALPDWRTVLVGAPLWALLMGVSAYSAPLLRGWETEQILWRVVLLFAFGGLLAFPIGLFVARWLSGGKGTEVRIAAALVGFGAGTAIITALLYALDYREYYSEWHEEAFTRIWFKEVVFTAAAAVYQFSALGMRLYFPLGFCALFAAAAWFSRLPH